MKNKIKILVSTYPFGMANPEAIEMLRRHGWELMPNPYGRKISRAELKILLPGADALIAGTEGIDEDTLKNANNLKLISRVGVGLDGINWRAVRKRKIEVAYTPGASTVSVAELALGFMIDLARGITGSTIKMRNKVWDRYVGKEMSGRAVGIIGLGRIGKKLAHLLEGFGCRILVNDIKPDRKFIKSNKLKFVSKGFIYKNSDFISLHVPLTKLTRNLINLETLRMMKKDAFLINTSRGGVVEEEALYNALEKGLIGGAAIDVYNQEPYSGPLAELKNIILTSHMGSCTKESRLAMETGAAQAVEDFFTGRKLKNRVPDELRRE